MSQHNLGCLYLDGKGVSKDYAEAAKWFRMAAEQGFDLAERCLGLCYLRGEGVSTDFPEAVKWFRMAVEHGDTRGVPQDFAKAVIWFREGAEQGNAAAQCHLGNCLLDGIGVSQDYVEAVKWFRKAAEQNLSAAQYSLGLCCLHAKGIPRDYTGAAKWFRKAAQQEHIEAQQQLSMCYRKGLGILRDRAEADKWYRRAAQQITQQSDAVRRAEHDGYFRFWDGFATTDNPYEPATDCFCAWIEGWRKAKEADSKGTKPPNKNRRSISVRVPEVGSAVRHTKTGETGVVDIHCVDAIERGRVTVLFWNGKERDVRLENLEIIDEEPRLSPESCLMLRFMRSDHHSNHDNDC